MARFIARRLLLMIPTVIGISLLVFLLVAWSPGGIGASLSVGSGGEVEGGPRAALEAYLEDRYGLNDPVLVQYGRWLARICPVKFGARARVSPAGERIEAPLPLKPPKAAGWFQTPSMPLAFPARTPDAGPERLYRLAAQEYARDRAAYASATAELEHRLAAYARAAGHAGAVSRSGRVDVRSFEQGEPVRTVVEWLPLNRAGDAARAAYARAETARQRLRAAVDAAPFPEAGIGIVNGIWLGSPDLGISFARGRPVSALIAAALPATLLLNLLAFPVIYGVAVPGGLLAASRRGSIIDSGLGLLSLTLYSTPVVLAGVLAVGFLARDQYLGWFPAAGLHAPAAESMTYLPSAGADGRWQRGYLLDLLWHVALPVLCLVYGALAVLAKQTRAAVLEQLGADYVRTARAKGAPERTVLLGHVFRNSLLPLITIFSTVFPAMLAGSVVIERVFSIPGMGNLLLQAIELRDREIILANALIIGVVNVGALLLADVLYAVADPRITHR